MKFICKKHRVVLIVEGTLRRIEPPPGSFGNPCRIMTMNPVTEGKHGDCEIEKVS